MKLALSIAVVASMFLAGCGKKEVSTDKKGKAAASNGSVRLSKNTDIPTYDYDGNEIFEDGVGGMAFVDDKSGRTLAYKEKTTTVEEKDAVSWDEADLKPSFKTVHFDFDKSGLRTDERDLVEEDIKAVSQVVQAGKKVVVSGHCDVFGSAAYNMALSERRAKTLKEEFVKAGVPGDHVQIVGFGQELPLVWSDETDRELKIKELAPNRRAEIEIL